MLGKSQNWVGTEPSIQSPFNGTSTDIGKMVFRKVLFVWYSILIFSLTDYTLTDSFRKPDNWRQIGEQTRSNFYTSNNVSLNRVEKKKLLGCREIF